MPDPAPPKAEPKKLDLTNSRDALVALIEQCFRMDAVGDELSAVVAKLIPLIDRLIALEEARLKLDQEAADDKRSARALQKDAFSSLLTTGQAAVGSPWFASAAGAGAMLILEIIARYYGVGVPDVR